MSSMRCWAMGPGRVLCSLNMDEHTDGLHAFRWTDEVCIDPTTAPYTTPYEAPITGPSRVRMPPINTGPAPVDTAFAEPGEAAPKPGLCFTCRCPKEAHDAEGGCAAHQCRTFVP